MLHHGKCGHLFKTYYLIHQWGWEYWFHRNEDLLFRGSICGSVFAKHHLVLSEISSYERLLLGIPHAFWVVARVVRQQNANPICAL